MRLVTRVSSVVLSLVLSLLVASPPASLAAQPLPSDVTFNLRRDFLEELMSSGPTGRSVGARWKASLFMDERSRVHDIGSDCELHVGARFGNNRKLANPAGIVIEPPNLCKRRLPGVPTGGSIGAAWQSFFDANVIGRTCEVTGFPRVFSEHSAGGEAGGSNPDHVVEIHPVVAMTCGQQSMDFESILRYFPGMRAITEASAEACISDRKLFVRGARVNNRDVYEFAEEGAKGSGGRCGNFVIVDAHFTKDYLRELSNGGDETALARVWIGESGPYALKVYAYKETPVAKRIATFRTSSDTTPDLELTLHGLLTYDYFTIVQTVQRESTTSPGTFEWIPLAELKEWREVRRPLALVVFGTVP